MEFKDVFSKAKGMLSGHEDQVEGAIDKAAATAKDKLPDQADGVIDGAVDKAKDFIEDEKA